MLYVRANWLLNGYIDPPSYFVAGGRLAIVILVIFSYPLQAHPCRASLDKVLAWGSASARGSKVPPPASAFKYFAMTTSILILSYIVAITVTELDLVSTLKIWHHKTMKKTHSCLFIRFYHLLDLQDQPPFHSYYRACSTTRYMKMILGNQARLSLFYLLHMVSLLWQCV